MDIIFLVPFALFANKVGKIGSLQFVKIVYETCDFYSGMVKHHSTVSMLGLL